MSFGICPLSSVPVRAKNNSRSEMTTQLLFGETVEILERKGKNWMLIRCCWDNAVGWVSSAQIEPITPTEYAAYSRRHAHALEVTQAVMAPNHLIPILMGSQLPLFDGLRLELGERSYTYSGQAAYTHDIPDPLTFVLRMARRYLFAPALKGGRSPMGIDASGFTQMVFKIAGFRLPRTAEDQVFCGSAVDFASQARPGDLAFFESRNGTIVHAGILMPDEEVIHAWGRVRIDKIDHFGIYDRKHSRYTHRLRVIKRILPGEYALEDSAVAHPEQAANQVEIFK